MTVISIGKRRAVAGFAAATLIAGAAGAVAGDLEYRVSAGAGQSDNVRRTPDNETDETIATGGLQFAFNQNEGRLNADVVGDFAYYDYTKSTYDNEFVGSLFADSSFAVIPERMQWVLSDQFGQILSDPFLPSTPDNRQNINVLTTGPDFFVGLGSQWRMRVSGRYTLTDYQDFPYDSSGTAGELALIRLLGDRSSVSLNSRLEQVRYDRQQLAADFDQREAYLRYEAHGARTNITADAGVTELKSDDALLQNRSGALLQLQASRRLSAYATITLRGGRRFATASGAFTSDQGITNIGLGTAPGRQTAEPFILDQGTLDWSFRRNRTSVSLDGSWATRTYKNNPGFDQTLTTYSARLGHDLSPRMTLDVMGTRGGVDFKTGNGDYVESQYSTSLLWRLTRSFTMELKYERYNRTADLAANEYTENRLWLTFGFGHGDPRQSRAAPTFGIDSQLAPR